MPHRTHVSPSPLIKKIKPTRALRDTGFGKPRGFWYEVNSDWRRWLRGEGYRWFVGNRKRNKSLPDAYLHRVHLRDCKVLKITTTEELDAFHAKYAEIRHPIYRMVEINWDRVSKDCDGVEIAPYQWERRLSFDMSWYYGWDCASGVIWRPRNATVKLIRKLT